MSGALTLANLGVWLINLDRAEARRATMAERLDALGLDWTRFRAVDGAAEADQLAGTYDGAAYARHMGQEILPGKIGCYHSHLGVWNALTDSDHAAALILEDDVMFHDDFLEALGTALAAADHWDTLRVCATRAKFPVTQAHLGRYRLNAYLGRFTGNGAYLVKRDVAERLLPGFLPMTRAFEYELGRYFAHDYRQFGLEPFPSHIEDSGESQIVGRANAGIRRLRGLRRLPYYGEKIGNYARRAAYLARTGRLRLAAT